MKQVCITLVLVSSFYFTQAQIADGPLTRNTIGIDVGGLANLSSNIRGGQFTLQNTLLPVSICWHHQLTGKLYSEVGGIYRGYGYKYPDVNEKYRLTAGYAGLNLKLKLVKRFYIVPSLDFYFANDYTGHFSDNNSSYSYSIQTYTVGPTISFEYFISKKVAINLSLLNINYGRKVEPGYTDGGLYRHSSITVWRTGYLGVYYNF